MRVAALYVATNGPYFNVPGVDPYDVSRDARGYSDSLPVVAHPPCERWGRYWFGGPSVKVRKTLGDDGGCFKAAIASVRANGGVLEHPEASHAWAAHGLAKPPKSGGWVRADEYGFTCCVEQGHYGHKARKATWLYAVDCDLPEFIWGKAEGKMKMDDGFHSKEAAIAARAHPDYKPIKRLSFQDRIVTPEEFKNILITMAQSVYNRRKK